MWIVSIHCEKIGKKMKKYKNVYVFLGRTLLYFCIVLGLLYFFSYLGQSQGTFIYNEF